jgi:hypothetical protein
MTFLPAAAMHGVVFGSLLLVLMLLNRRDRRDVALRATIGECLPRELRGMVAVSARLALWGTRARVTLDMECCDVSHTWQVIERLGPRLPRGTTLAVDAPTLLANCRTSIRVVAHPGGRSRWRRVQALTARGA